MKVDELLGNVGRMSVTNAPLSLSGVVGGVKRGVGPAVAAEMEWAGTGLTGMMMSSPWLDRGRLEYFGDGGGVRNMLFPLADVRDIFDRRGGMLLLSKTWTWTRSDSYRCDDDRDHRNRRCRWYERRDE